jgi:hypothetical protein
VNTVLGSYAAYGLVGLRYEWRAILGFGGIMLLQSLIAIQLMIFSVYVTPNQVWLVGPLPSYRWQRDRMLKPWVGLQQHCFVKTERPVWCDAFVLHASIVCLVLP